MARTAMRQTATNFLGERGTRVPRLFVVLET
jgi:hypothetical protein